MTCLIPCPPVIFPGVFQPCATLKPWMEQGGSWEQMGHPCPEGLSSNFSYDSASPFPKTDAYNQHQALANSTVCLLLDASHGVLKSTLSPYSPTFCFTLGLRLGIHLAVGSSAGQDEPHIPIDTICVCFNTQLCLNIGLKLFLSLLLPQLRTTMLERVPVS